jgi:cell division protein FtsB
LKGAWQFCRHFPIFAEMRKAIDFISRSLSNFYVGTSILFLVWITFFDGNDLITLVSNKIELMKTEREIQFYQAKVEEVTAEKDRLMENPDALERFAREKFLMKKADEDVFVIPQEKDENLLDRLIGF